MAEPRLVTDELFDRVVFRPLAAGVVRAVAPTPLTPNQLTVAAAMGGVGAGVALGVHAPIGFAVLIGLMMTLDCADGQLARLRGGGDVWGRIVDGIGDYTTAVAFHLGLLTWLVQDHGVARGLVWTLASALSMAWSAYLLDKYKRRYRGDVDDLEAVHAARDRARGVRRLFFLAFLPYAAGLNQGPAIPDRDAYRERVRPAMTLWLWLGPTTHYVLAAVLVVLAQPLLYAQITAVGLTLLTFATLLLQRRLESRAPAVVERAAA